MFLQKIFVLDQTIQHHQMTSDWFPCDFSNFENWSTSQIQSHGKGPTLSSSIPPPPTPSRLNLKDNITLYNLCLRGEGGNREQSRDVTNKNNNNTDKNSLVSDWRKMTGSLLFPRQGNSNCYRDHTFSVEPSPSTCYSGLATCHLIAWVMLSPGCYCFFCSYPRFLLKMCCSVTQPFCHRHYLSSYHNFYCPHRVGKISLYTPRKSALFQYMGLFFSAHRTLPRTTFEGLHDVYSTDMRYCITSLQNREPTLQQLRTC